MKPSAKQCGKTVSSLKVSLEKDKNVLSVCELMEDKLYFVTYSTYRSHRNTTKMHFFTVDEQLVYRNFFGDFGPLNIAAVYKYNQLLRGKLWGPGSVGKAVVHYTVGNGKHRVNAAFLLGTFALHYLHMSPQEVLRRLCGSKPDFLEYQDASPAGVHHYIRLTDCLAAFTKAVAYGFVDLDDFSLEEHTKYESLANGDMSWIVPGTLLAFSGPWDKPPGNSYHTPAFYVKHFHRIDVRTVIRLNVKAYSAATFTKAGISHYDLFFPDGTCPNEDIVEKFLKICESTRHAVAVHCKAGLGRTGCLIGAYLIKHYHMTALEAIAWMRICRPGCVIGSQQSWLENVQHNLLVVGNLNRARFHGGQDNVQRFKYGIYSDKQLAQEGETSVARISSGPRYVPAPTLRTLPCTQGDRLNKIKRQKFNNKIKLKF